ncbi:MAG: hypothetical protein JW768_11965 [Chitinispirillaceae bacterium]|nr:hypothetical protein [Chitinispirillaceae bacterium]
MSLDVYLKNQGCLTIGQGQEVFFANITNNLGNMAAEAGIYEIVWMPEEHGIKNARQLIKPLRKAIAKMKKNPARFQKHNAPNGWGWYDHFVPWLEKFVAVCEQHPDAAVGSAYR